MEDVGAPSASRQAGKTARGRSDCHFRHPACVENRMPLARRSASLWATDDRLQPRQSLVPAPYLAAHFRATPTTYWGVAGLTFISAIGSVILAFFVIFIGRYITAPARLYAKLQASIPPVLKSDIHLILDNAIGYHAGIVDANGNKLPPAKAFSVRVSN